METSEILGTSVDKTMMPPLNQKRVVAFINHFLISSCGFLNDFASKAESKFIVLERKLQKIEAALLILEAKLESHSLPITEQTAVSNNEITTKPVEEIAEEQSKNITVIDKKEQEQEEKEVEVEVQANPKEVACGVLACNDARYRKFFKMLQFGVPIEAVKLKMRTEGFENTEILNTPNLMLQPDCISHTEPEV